MDLLLVAGEPLDRIVVGKKADRKQIIVVAIDKINAKLCSRGVRRVVNRLSD